MNIGMTVDQLVSELRENLGVDSTDLNDAACLLLLNRSFWDLCDRYEFSQEDSNVSDTTGIGVQFVASPEIGTLYGTNDANSIKVISLVDTDSNEVFILDRMSVKEFAGIDLTDNTVVGRPTRYYKDGTTIWFDIYTDKDYTFQIFAEFLLADLVAGTDPPGFPRNWHEELLFGATWRGQMKLGDYNRMQQVRRIAAEQSEAKRKVLPKAKEEEDSSRSGLEVLRNEM